MAAACFIAYWGFECLQHMAGQSTIIDIALGLALHVLAKVEVAIAITLAGLATVWALAERALRRRKTDYMQGRIRELEQRLDPNRSTSGLTSRGKTNPRDIRS